MNLNFEKYLIKTSNASKVEEIEVIQSLWSGYGKISRYQLFDSTFKTVVVKNISLNQLKNHPRGWNTNNSHNRKVKSYEVETFWYQNWNQLTNEHCRTPKFLGSFSEGKDQWIILEDLNTHFPLRKQTLNYSEITTCLKWLANFHATFLNKKPKGLWEIGTYWHLATRPDELIKEWRQMYPVACTDFTRFLLGWMPSHQKVNKYNLDLMNTVLSLY